MTIRRAPRPESNFTQTRNDVIDDPRLSLRALGLLIKILRQPDHWGTTREELATRCKEGVATVRTALKELRLAGYIVLIKNQDERGRWQSESMVYDTPQETPVPTITEGRRTGGRKSASGVTRENTTKPQVAPEAESPPVGTRATKELTLQDQHLTLKETEEESSDLISPFPAGKGSAAASRDAFPREDVEILCQHLADWVVRNGSLKPSIDKKWRDAARLMIDNDGRELPKIMALIDWCQQNGWYRSKIRTMPKFRQQYDTMRLDALAEWEKSQRAPFQRPSDLVDVGNGVKISRRNAEALQMSAELHAAAELTAPRQSDPDDELWAQIEASRKAQQLAATQKAERELRAIGGAR